MWEKMLEIKDTGIRGTELLEILKKESDFFEEIEVEEIEGMIKDGWITFENDNIIVWIDGE